MPGQQPPGDLVVFGPRGSWHPLLLERRTWSQKARRRRPHWWPTCFPLSSPHLVETLFLQPHTLRNGLRQLSKLLRLVHTATLLLDSEQSVSQVLTLSWRTFNLAAASLFSSAWLPLRRTPSGSGLLDLTPSFLTACLSFVLFMSTWELRDLASTHSSPSTRSEVSQRLPLSSPSPRMAHSPACPEVCDDTLHSDIQALDIGVRLNPLPSPSLPTPGTPGTQFVPIAGMNSLYGQVIYTGHPRDGHPRHYVEACKADVAIMHVDPNSHDLVLRQVFRRGLRGQAAHWYGDYLKAREDQDIAWKSIEEDFIDKFRRADPALESLLASEAHMFSRQHGETLNAYVKRAEKLYNQLKGLTRCTMMTSFVRNLADGKIDVRLQERVSDRLYADGKWRSGFADEALTFNDIKIAMWDCDTSASEKLVREDDDNLPAAEMDPFRMLARSQETMTEMVRRMEETNLLTAKHLSEQNNQRPRPSDRLPPQSATTLGNTMGNMSSGPERARDPEFFYCFNCGGWGHMGYNCKEPKCQSAEFGERRQRWENERSQMCRERAQQLAAQRSGQAGSQAITSKAANFVNDPVGMVRPPSGFRPLPLRNQAMHTRYQLSREGLVQIGDPISKFSRVRDITDEEEDAVAKPAKRDHNAGKHRAHPYEDHLRDIARESLRQAGEPPETRITESDRDVTLAGPSSQGQSQTQNYRPPGVEDAPEMSAADPTTANPPPDPTPMTEERFRQLLPQLMPFIDKLRSQQPPAPVVVQPAPAVGPKRPRHELEKIRATEEFDVAKFELGQYLKDTPITLNVLQLLQIAPSVRQQLSRLMQCRRKMKSRLGREHVSNMLLPFRDFMTAEMNCELGEFVTCETKLLELGSCKTSDVVYCDTAHPEDSVATTLGYVEGFIEGHRCNSIMIDGGSSLDLVNLRFLTQHQLPRIPLPKPGLVRMANDQVHTVEHCAFLRVVIGGILAVVRAYAMGDHDDWDILLGRTWLRRVRAIEDHDEEKLTVRGLKGTHQVIPILPAPNLFERIRPLPTFAGAPRVEVWDEEIVLVEDDEEILAEVEEILNDMGKHMYEEAGQDYPGLVKE